MLTWLDLAIMPEAALAQIDIALVNLICAAGLPGAERMDPGLCMARIAELTKIVEEETEKHLYLFFEDRDRYGNSIEYFRMSAMITILQRDCGIRYNPAKIPHDAPFYAEDSFIFGIFQGDGGTCASLPVLYTAIGRRLGYPLKLVSAHGHRFCRWDDPPDGMLFNIEATGKGCSTPPNQHYREGIFAAPVEYEKDAGTLLSLTPRRELASFVRDRAQYWRDHGCDRNMVNCLAWEAELDGYPYSMRVLEHSLKVWHGILLQRSPFKLIKFKHRMPPRRFRLIPAEVEDNMVALGILDDLLRDFLLKRPPYAPHAVPILSEVIYEPSEVFRYDAPWKFADNHER